MANPAELCSALCFEHMWGEFQASELQETFHDQVTVQIPCVLPFETRSEEITGAVAGFNKSGFNAANNP